MREFFATYPASHRHIPESIARGLDLVVGLPRDTVTDMMHGPVTDAHGIEEWLETGKGDPWQASGD